MASQMIESTGMSPEFVSNILDRPVTAIDETRIGIDRGFASTVLRLALHPDGHQPSTVVAKVAFHDDTAARREVTFYRDIAPSLSPPAPHCWFAGRTPRGQHLVVLDDLAEATPGDALTGAGTGQVQAVLHAMTPLWRHGSKSPGDGLPHHSPTATELTTWQNRYAAQWNTQAPALEQHLPAEILTIGEQLRSRLAVVAARLAAAAPSVIHADLHLDNVLFTEGTAPQPVIIDWASAQIGPLALDVFPFLALSLIPEDHDRHAANLVEDLLADLRPRDRPEFVDHGRRALLRHFAGIIGWTSHPPTGSPREAALRHAALHDGRLVNALQQWDVKRCLTST